MTPSEKLHADLRRYLAVSAARSRIRCGWPKDDAVREGARLHGLPLGVVEPLVIEAEEACSLTRQRIAAETVRIRGWQPAKINA